MYTFTNLVEKICTKYSEIEKKKKEFLQNQNDFKKNAEKNEEKKNAEKNDFLKKEKEYLLRLEEHEKEMKKQEEKEHLLTQKLMQMEKQLIEQGKFFLDLFSINIGPFFPIHTLANLVENYEIILENIILGNFQVKVKQKEN